MDPYILKIAAQERFIAKVHLRNLVRDAELELGLPVENPMVKVVAAFDELQQSMRLAAASVQMMALKLNLIGRA